MPNAPLPHRIEILAFSRAQILDVTGPAQIFATANDLTPPDRPKPYEIAVVSLDAEVVTSSGLTLKSDPAAGRAGAVGTLIVAGGYGVDGARCDRALIDWIRQRASAAERTAEAANGTRSISAAVAVKR